MKNRNSIKKQLYYPQLDSIRGLSFLGIFLYHSLHPGIGTGWVNAFLKYLFDQLPLAIDVFFLLSSFLLTRLGLVEYEKRQNFSFVNYFTRRVLRIWPLYYVLMFFSFIIFPLIALKVGASMSLPDPLFYVFFVSNFYHVDHVFFLRILWTLSVEEQFYLVLGVALKFFAKYLARIFSLFLIVSVIYSAFFSSTDSSAYFHTLTYFFDFAAGGIAAILFSRKSRVILWLANLKGWKKVLFYCYLPMHFAVFYSMERTGGGDWIDLISRYFFVVYISLLIIEQVGNVKRVTVLEKNKFLIYTGKISYGLYCFHGISITGIDLAIKHFHIEMSQYLIAAVAFCTNYFFATISYIFFEKPFLRLKDKIRRI